MLYTSRLFINHRWASLTLDVNLIVIGLYEKKARPFSILWVYVPEKIDHVIGHMTYHMIWVRCFFQVPKTSISELGNGYEEMLDIQKPFLQPKNVIKTV